MNNRPLDAGGDRIVTIRFDQISDAFRADRKKYFATADQISYGIETFAVNCTDREVRELKMSFYDSTSTVLAASDLDSKTGPPGASSLSSYLMQKVCGG